ncbi:MAG: copper chaperone PCu(A)C [Steroidobacteraceae bacterium]
MKSMRARIGGALVAAGLGMVLAAPAMADVVASEAWSRATVPGAKTGAGYLVLTNTGDKPRKLLRITSPACDTVTLHLSSIDSQGVAHMWPVAKLEIAPGEVVRFVPNGLHVMFNDLTAPFEVGKSVPLSLRFEDDERDMVVQLEVRPLTTAAPMDHKHPTR